ncbi:MAG TPA: radical SAM protein [Gemmatimonadales bacterium]|nr:radical SAM protein [Gemmatimonadales bacterium]
MTLPVLGRLRRGVTFVEHPARTLINPPESTGMPFWSVNPYIGCEFGCTYCYARFTHGYAIERARGAARLPPDVDAQFERLILVKRREDLLAALDRDLARVRRQLTESRQALSIGTATDPYQPAERRFRLTRAILERLGSERGLHLSIVTKSTLVRRDAQLLAGLTGKHQVAVHISLISASARMVRRFERRSPVPGARLRTLTALGEAGVPSGLICAPVLPGITDQLAALRRLLRAVKDAGGRFAFGIPLRLPPGARDPFLPVVAEHYPTLLPRYLAAYARSASAPARYSRWLSQRFHAVASEVGLATQAFSDRTPSPYSEQLGLWS